ncbi:hypothetical protein [Mesorhizobium sp. WSM3862]|uniref:hypothetical protein n=1 Tax=Mesorhizobium sp. WSM3862 TaxID=632858 RepID=UPI001FE14DEA|nr:hypothetical protein [Mesorhizobium sp. WSM3862]
MELTPRLGSMMPYRQAARVLAEFLPVEPTETHATVRKRTIRIGERLHDQVAEEELHARAQTDDADLKCSFPAIDAKSSSSASILRMFEAPIPIPRATSSSLWPDAAAAGGAKAASSAVRRKVGDGPLI